MGLHMMSVHAAIHPLTPPAPLSIRKITFSRLDVNVSEWCT